MGRKKKLSDEQIISGTEQYFNEICEGNTKLLTYKNIAAHLSSVYGIIIADYDLKKNKPLIEYVKFLKNEQKNERILTSITFQRLNVDDFIRKNNSTTKIKKALVDLDSYYAKYADSIGLIIEENKKLHADLLTQKHKIHELEEKIDKLVKEKTRETPLKEQITKLKGILNTYVYPELANKLLAEEGFLKDIPDIISPKSSEHVISVKDNLGQKILSFDDTIKEQMEDGKDFTVDQFVDDLYV